MAGRSALSVLSSICSFVIVVGGRGGGDRALRPLFILYPARLEAQQDRLLPCPGSPIVHGSRAGGAVGRVWPMRVQTMHARWPRSDCVDRRSCRFCPVRGAYHSPPGCASAARAGWTASRKRSTLGAWATRLQRSGLGVLYFESPDCARAQTSRTHAHNLAPRAGVGECMTSLLLSPCAPRVDRWGKGAGGRMAPAKTTSPAPPLMTNEIGAADPTCERGLGGCAATRAVG